MKTHLMLAALALAGTTAQADPAPNRPADGAGRPAAAHQAAGASHGGRPVGAGHSGTPTQATHVRTLAVTGPTSFSTAPTHKSSSAPAGHWGTPTVPGRAVAANSTKTSTTNSWKTSATTASASRPNVYNYHLAYGKPFRGGYYYPGRDHHHWTYHGWSKKYHCECYWCPSTCQYYYWCASADCYYPVSYYESAPCPSPEPAGYATPAPCPRPAYVSYKVPFVAYSIGYKTVTVPCTSGVVTTACPPPYSAPCNCQTPAPAPITYPAPAPVPVPTPAPVPVPTPAPAPPGAEVPPADVPPIPQ